MGIFMVKIVVWFVKIVMIVILLMDVENVWMVIMGIFVICYV